MKRQLILFSTVALMCVAGSASAEPLFGGSHPLRIGGGLDVGVPAGGALSLVVHPKEDWLVPSLGLTYNGLSFGGRLSVKLDPLALAPRVPIGLFVDWQGGLVGEGNIPGHSDLPSVGYDYMNFYGGLRLGTSRSFQWDFELGPTYVAARTGNFQSVVPSGKGLTVGNPTVNGWVFPTFTTGFQLVFP